MTDRITFPANEVAITKTHNSVGSHAQISLVVANFSAKLEEGLIFWQYD